MVTEDLDPLGELAESLAERVEAKRAKAATKVPDVYSSGMRGSEKPPHLREQEKKDAAAKDRKKPQVDKDGKTVIKFKAKPKQKSSEIIAQLQKRLDALEKDQGKKSTKAKPNKKYKVTI